MSSARETFLSELPEALRTSTDTAELEALQLLLEAGVETARGAHPEVEVPVDVFVRRLGHHLEFDQAAAPEAPPLDARTIAGTFRKLHWADLWLASACAIGQPAAIAKLERTHLVDVPVAVAHLRRDDTFGDEVQQRLRERLLVRTAIDEPRIGAYTGRGPLGGWIRVAATRVALNLIDEERGPRSVAPSSTADTDGSDAKLAAAVATMPDFELDHLRARFAPMFKRAFQEALLSLPVETRRLLRQHLVDGLSVEQLGLQERAHRTTIARRLADAREELFDRTRATILAHTKLDPAEFEALGGYLHAEMAESVPRLLTAPPAALSDEPPPAPPDERDR